MNYLTRSILFIILLLANQSHLFSQWTHQSHPLQPGLELSKIHFFNQNEGWISINNGHLLRTTNGGQVWNVVFTYSNDTLFLIIDPALNMWWLNDTYGWLACSKGRSFENVQGAVVLRTTNSGSNWQKYVISQIPGDLAVQIQFVNQNVGYLSVFNLITNQPKIYKSIDVGMTWNPLTTNLLSGSIFYFVSENLGWAVNNSDMADPPYGIIGTNNGGQTWNQLYLDNMSGFEKIKFFDENNGYVLRRNYYGQSGFLLKTTNGGQNWIPIDIPLTTGENRGKDFYFLNSNIGWVAAHWQNGNPNRALIAFTSDGEQNWSVTYPPYHQSLSKIFSIFFIDQNIGWFVQEKCFANCDQPDSLIIWTSVIGYTTNNGGLTNIEQTEMIPDEFKLYNNYPNPFNPVTILRYDVASPVRAKLVIYDVLGNIVSVLVDEFRLPGSYEHKFDAKNLSSRVYYYKLTAGNFSDTKSMLIIK